MTKQTHAHTHTLYLIVSAFILWREMWHTLHIARPSIALTHATHTHTRAPAELQPPHQAHRIPPASPTNMRACPTVIVLRDTNTVTESSIVTMRPMNITAQVSMLTLFRLVLGRPPSIFFARIFFLSFVLFPLRLFGCVCFCCCNFTGFFRMYFYGF